MKVMVIVKATPDSEAGVMPSEELMQAVCAATQELIDAGVLVSGEGLQPSSKGVRVRLHGDACTVTPGPFSATGELIAGFSIWNVASMDEAVAWVKKFPAPMLAQSDIEIRPLF